MLVLLIGRWVIKGGRLLNIRIKVEVVDVISNRKNTIHFFMIGSWALNGDSHWPSSGSVEELYRILKKKPSSPLDVDAAPRIYFRKKLIV